jgi:hypothetical protein
MTKIDMLNAQRAEKFTALCALVARDLGYGELPQLSEVDRNHIEGEAKHYVELWEETVEIKINPTIRPITPLRRLLAEYHDTCERILDEQEIEVGPRDLGGGRRPSTAFELVPLGPAWAGIGIV